MRDEVKEIERWIKSERKPLYESSAVYGKSQAVMYGEWSETHLLNRFMIFQFQRNLVVRLELEEATLAMEWLSSAVRAIRSACSFKDNAYTEPGARAKFSTNSPRSI